MSEPTFEEEVREVCNGIADMLVEKNKAYGNSALDPVRIFSKASPEEQILVRIDDKLSRIARGSAAGEDPVKDSLGYLVLLTVLRRRAERAQTKPAAEEFGGRHPTTYAEANAAIDARIRKEWERVPESLAVRTRVKGGDFEQTLMPGDPGYDEVAAALGVSSTRVVRNNGV